MNRFYLVDKCLLYGNCVLSVMNVFFVLFLSLKYGKKKKLLKGICNFLKNCLLFSSDDSELVIVIFKRRGCLLMKKLLLSCEIKYEIVRI